MLKPTDPIESHSLFLHLGKTVRLARARRGMTRKMLSQESGVSERYLAQIENGEGNPSLLMLDSIATAVGQPIADLLPAPAPAIFEEVGDRAKRIALIGLRGAGKSSLGAAAAKTLGFPFIEIGQEIERRHGAASGALIEIYGQKNFRRYELELLEGFTKSEETFVMATSGGIVAEPQSFATLLHKCHVIWLKASPEEHMQRVVAQGDMRPMARNKAAMQDLVTILEARNRDYARAHAVVDTSGLNIHEAEAALLQVIKNLIA